MDNGRETKEIITTSEIPTHHKQLNTRERNSIKMCRYGCGTIVYWSDAPEHKESRIRFVELYTGIKHDYPRCADILKDQGKDVGILKQK